jgi:hypothetical protein
MVTIPALLPSDPGLPLPPLWPAAPWPPSPPLLPLVAASSPHVLQEASWPLAPFGAPVAGAGGSPGEPLFPLSPSWPGPTNMAIAILLLLERTSIRSCR